MPHRRTTIVVDDHRTFSELLAMALDAHAGLRCLGTASSASAAITLLEQHTVDVVLLDYRLGADDGVETTRRITSRWPAVAVVLLTGYPTSHLMTDAAAAGASALLPKDGSLTDLLDVLTSVRAGHFMVPPALLRLLIAEARSGPATVLTPREQDVLHLLSMGLDVRRIAGELGITVSTSRGYVKAILTKLDAHTQLEAVAVAHRAGLLVSGAR